jgi:Phage Tail Collar Domain/Collagen triple helix repeat (20 copies)
VLAALAAASESRVRRAQSAPPVHAASTGATARPGPRERPEPTAKWGRKGHWVCRATPEHRPQGEQGDAGPQGLQGDKGDAGAPGLQGPKGDTGLQGLEGDAGAQGPKGDTGPQGLKGDTGPQGPKGDTGPQGPPDPSAVDFLSRVGTETGGAAASRGRECTLGEIMLTAAVVATSGVPAAGQMMSISDNTALFSLLGTNYGGDGKTTFRLPDLRSVTPNGLTYSICVDGIYPSRL